MITIVIIVMIFQFGPAWFLFSVHGCKGRYLAYLINWASGLSFYGSRVSLFFFLRPASFLDVAVDPQYNMKQYNKCILFKFPTFCYKIQKYVEETMCCIGFGRPIRDVVQELLEVEQADNVWRMKKPKATNGRREDYVRLPFVDDLCQHSAMQDFLRRKPSSQAKLTGRQIRSS